MSFRRKSSGAPAEIPGFNPHLGMLTLWDMSNEPSNNADPRERMGEAAKVRGVAVVGLNKEKGGSTYADGITHKRQKTSAFPIDPDSFVCRLFGTPKNRYGSWMVRLTADMDENQSGENCRSTMIVDNANDMKWAWVTDAFNLVDAPSGGDIIGEGLQYDQAGFLESLYEKEYSFAEPKRGALAMSLHRNKGFVADDGKIAQLSHVLTFVSGGSGSVSAATGQGLGPRFADLAASSGGGGNNRSRSNAELALRGDAPIKFSSGVGRWHMDTPPDIKPDEQEAHLVYLFLHLPGKKDDELNTGNDGNCDFERIEKDAGKQIIRGFVYLPKPGGGG